MDRPSDPPSHHSHCGRAGGKPSSHHTPRTPDATARFTSPSVRFDSAPRSPLARPQPLAALSPALPSHTPYQGAPGTELYDP